MTRINSGEFAGNAGAGGGRGAGRGGRGGGAGQWLDGGKAYRSGAMRIDTATGESTPLPPEPRYQPPGLDRPLTNPTPSADGKKLLFAANSHTVMIRKTASDYWVLDKSDNSWHRIGAKSTGGLMLAKFSPDGTRVAYLGDPKWNLYVEDLKSGAAKQLTTDASDDIIDGTSDWNNNEEFGLAGLFLLESGRQAHRLLPVRSKRGAGFRAHQLYRPALSGHHQVQISQAPARRIPPFDSASSALRAAPRCG